MRILISLTTFIIAGLCEIVGGYLIWLWLKEGKSLLYSLLGGILLFLYGIIATWQTPSFGRVYATYGGIFIIMALIWSWMIDGLKPDKWDIIGAVIVLFGVFIMMYMPRDIN